MSPERKSTGATMADISPSIAAAPAAAPRRYPRGEPRGNWAYPDPRYNTDEQIIGDWKILEQMIREYVDDIFVTHIPDIDTTMKAYPYEIFKRHSDLAGAIVRSERHAKYMFQLSIWNLLNAKYLGHMATEWSGEERGASWTANKTRGLAEVMFRLTCKYPPKSAVREERNME